MSDDPFEVKLRDNFELLADEYSESIKRAKMLKERVLLYMINSGEFINSRPDIVDWWIIKNSFTHARGQSGRTLCHFKETKL